jgi:Methyltransferase domain
VVFDLSVYRKSSLDHNAHARPEELIVITPQHSQTASLELTLKRLLDNPPKLHRPMDFFENNPTAEDGLVGNWGIQRSFLEQLDKFVAPGALTLETGCGLSTVCFAILGAEHICISPMAKEHQRVRNYCAENQISTERIRFIAMKSGAALPALNIGDRRLDFALIDGSHAFPVPIVDYFYANDRLKVGGFLAVDDLQISGVGILHKFLLTEPAYETVKLDGLKTGIYRKVAETIYPRDWSGQRFNSTFPDYSYLPVQTRVREKLRSAPSILRNRLGKIAGLRRARHRALNPG